MAGAVLATFLFALSVVFATRTTRMLGGTTANFLRLCLSTALLAVWAHGFGPGLGGGAAGWFMLSGCIGFGLGDLALYQALPRIGPRLTALMVHCLAAPVAMGTEWIWMGTWLTPLQLVFGFVILAGVALALAPEGRLNARRGVLIAGILLGLIAALGQGLGAVVSRKAYQVVHAAGGSVDGLTAAYQRILGGLVFAALPFLLILIHRRLDRGAGGKSETGVASGKDRWREAWPWVVLNSLAGPTLGVGCYQWALQTTPSGVVLPIVATTPLVVIPFAFLLEGERPTVRSMLGGAMAVAGAVGLASVR